jgi:drug/metabolite transporter (DMT)-like permease
MVAVAVLLYSGGPVLVGAADAGGVAFSFWRLWVAVPILVAATGVHRAMGGRLPRGRELRWLVHAGLAFAVNQVLFMSAVKATGVTDYVLLTTLQPVAVALLAWRVWGENPGHAFRLWTLLAMSGLVVVFYGASTGPDGHLGGMVMGAGSVMAFAVFFVISKQAREEVDVIPFLLGFTVFAAVAVSAFAVAVGVPVGSPTRGDLVLALVVAAGPGGIGHFIMTWPLRYLPANIPAVMRLAQPVLSALMAAWFLGEIITSRHVIGGVLTIGGVLGALLSTTGRRFARSELPPPTAGEPIVAPADTGR